MTDIGYITVRLLILAGSIQIKSLRPSFFQLAHSPLWAIPLLVGVIIVDRIINRLNNYKCVMYRRKFSKMQ